MVYNRPDMNDEQIMRLFDKQMDLIRDLTTAVRDLVDSTPLVINESSIMESLAKIAETSGHAWDKVEDPDAEIAEMRGD